MKVGAAFLIFIFILTGPVFAGTTAWQVSKSDHFLVYSASSNRDFSDKVLNKAEDYYGQIANWLGYSRRDSFWTWNNRCKIYIYKNKEEYAAKTGNAPWSRGTAILTKRTIVSYEDAPDFLESVLPHELAHLIFRDFVGDTNSQIPLWLDEGVAMAQERLKRGELDAWVHRMIREKKWIEMKTFMQVRSLEEASGNQAAMFYAQAESMARFLIEDYGSKRFAAFCRSLRDSESPEEALRKNYPKAFPDLKSFESLWVEYASKTNVRAVAA